MDRVRIDRLSSGISVASGGTRNRINFDRPWQTPIIVNPAACPFEVKDQDVVARFDEQGTAWSLLPNLYTPFPFHRLLIPDSCWSSEKLRELGGRTQIEAVLRILGRLLSAGSRELWFGVHIGPSAGQNISHLHYHWLEPLPDESPEQRLSFEPSRDSALTIYEESAIRVSAEGCRAGQCVFYSTAGDTDFNEDFASVLATVLSVLLKQYSKNFKSVQGLPPDFVLTMKFVGRQMKYGSYIPILNHWGFTEYLGLIESRPLILPWPHETTAVFLRSRWES